MDETVETACQIINLPECVLRILFSYLDSTTLYQLTRTCRYFQYFITDPVFWRYIDARNNPNTNDKVQYCSDRIHEKTTHIFLKAKDKTSGLVRSDFFKNINPFANIRVLALENQRLHGSRLTLKDFPPGLEELSLKGTDVKSSTYFFQHSALKMKKLRVLILDKCQWVTCSFLMAVAKYDNLEIISAIKCLRLHLNMVPYLNIARYGCGKLKVFDCRFTNLGHELLRTFYPKESVQSMYFQSLKSAELDYKEFIFNRSYMRAESVDPPRAGDSNICDESLFDYINSSACEITEKIYDSMLYKDPYPECTCRKKGKCGPPPKVAFTDEYYICIAPRRKPIKFVCQRHLQDVERLSNHFRDFFLTNQHQFYADVKASEVESEPGSSDSESDENSGTCCMYGMGRSMILLSPGNNPGTIREEVLEFNPEEQQQGGRVVSIFISTPLRETCNIGQQNAQIIPSTSGSTQENRANENSENSRNESKRCHCEDQGDPQPSSSKRMKTSENIDGLSDEAKTAEVSKLLESAGEIHRSLNRFVENTVEICKRNAARPERGPTTSSFRDEDVEMENDNRHNHLQENRGDKAARVVSSGDNSVASTSRYRIKFNAAEAERMRCGRMTEELEPVPRISINFINPDDASNQNNRNVETGRGESSSGTGRGETGRNQGQCPQISIKLSEDNGERRDSPQVGGAQGGENSRGVHRRWVRVRDGRRECPGNEATIRFGLSNGEPGRQDNGTEQGEQFRNAPRNWFRIRRRNADNEYQKMLMNIPLNDASGQPCWNADYQNRANEGESSRQNININGPRTAIITITRNRERNHFVNPLFVQIENKHTKKKSRLRRLSLRGFRKITDVALLYIKNLKLDLLDLTYTSVTKEGIENFLAYNPNCRVVHPLYCVCKPLNPF